MTDAQSLTLPKPGSMTRRRIRRPRRPNVMSILCAFCSAWDAFAATDNAAKHREIVTVFNLTYMIAFAIASVAYYRRRHMPTWVRVWFIGPGFAMGIFLTIHPM